MFSANYWYIGFFILLVVVMEVFAVMFLSRYKWLSRAVLWALALYVVVSQAVELSQTKTFYWAFSTISYWLFVLGAIVPVRSVKSACATFSFVAGALYLVAFLVKPEMINHMGDLSIGYFKGIMIHDVLFVGSLIMLSQFKMKRWDMGVVGGMLAIVVMFTELGKYVFHWTTINEFLEGMIEASILKTEYLPNLQLTWWWYILWYIVVFALLWGIWESIYFVNRRLTQRSNAPSGEILL